MIYTVSKISQIFNTNFFGDGSFKIDFIIIDSRMIIPSENTVFFAIKTKINDGHKYIKSLYNRGLRSFVVEKSFKEFYDLKDANFIFVENTVKSLQELAIFHRNLFRIPVIGITGSNGKTIVKEWLNQILSTSKSVIQSPKSYNSQIGVPLSIWELNSSHEIAIFEAGISKPNEMNNLEKIINPTIGLLTNIGDAHQENFESLEQKISEKLLLFKNSEIVIYCSTDDLINKLVFEKLNNKKLFTFSNKPNANLYLKCIGNNFLEIIYKNIAYKIQINFNDFASINNILAVISVLLVLDDDAIPSDFDFSQIKSLEMRMQQIQGINNCTIINDSYNADLSSLRIALDVFNSQNQNSKKTIILSDFQELVTDKEKLYKNISTILNNATFDRFIGVGDMLIKYKDFFTLNSVFYSTTEELLQNISSLNFNNETILLKASRKYQFELLSQALQLKNHRTVFEINMSSYAHNLQYFKTFLKSETKIMAMVKAFSYGSGSFEIANFLQQKNIDYLAVANVDEGIELRNAGISIPILILNPDTSNFDVFDKYLLEPEIYNFKILDEFYNTIKHNIYNRYPIHLKINTGMNRLGFSKNDLPNIIKRLKIYDKIFVKSVFSHLVGSGEVKFDDFTYKQIDEFNIITDFLYDNLNYKFLKHILNSAGIERFSNYQFDMVRLGIGLYGISSVDNNKLKHIGTLKTQILQIIDVTENETIGYNRVGVATKNSRIATIAIGYADGLDRKLSNGVGKVLVNNNIVPIIGNICMDLTMIDVTGIIAKEGDEVIIFNDLLTINSIAKNFKTIPYEILTSIPQRVKRVYIWE